MRYWRIFIHKLIRINRKNTIFVYVSPNTWPSLEIMLAISFDLIFIRVETMNIKRYEVQNR